jgi:hypothetical protein
VKDVSAEVRRTDRWGWFCFQWCRIAFADWQKSRGLLRPVVLPKGQA